MLASEAHVSACEETTVEQLSGIFLFEQIHVLIVLHGYMAYCENLSSELFVSFAEDAFTQTV